MKNFQGKIYKATLRGTNQVYIGSTTYSIEKRRKDHLQKAKKSDCGYFQKALNTYGPDAFSWTQIDTANSLNELARKEREHIFTHKSDKTGFNQDKGGGFQKKVYQYDTKDGSFIAEYDNLETAAKAINASRQCISNCCRGQNKTCKGSYWSYNKVEKFKLLEKDQRKKKVIQLSLSGTVLAIFDSVAKASKETGISKTCIARCCRGERQSTNGFKFTYT